ncbi:MAG: (2Fe-2S)-binding protein [Woeseiaceae bacterium]|nr:(2Fe-2S)-binding protein [Woeseiaceae bacterium]
MIRFTINDEEFEFEGAEDTPLLWALRDDAGLTGSKYGCGIGMCGACTVHVDGEAWRSCVLPVKAVEGRSVTTIEGLSPDASHPVQRAWQEVNVPQCGYCQSGQIMAAAAMLARLPAPSDEDIDREHSVICRCGAYQRIRAAIHRASELSQKASKDE